MKDGKSAGIGLPAKGRAPALVAGWAPRISQTPGSVSDFYISELVLRLCRRNRTRRCLGTNRAYWLQGFLWLPSLISVNNLSNEDLFVQSAIYGTGAAVGFAGWMRRSFSLPAKTMDVSLIDGQDFAKRP